jgi:uncharacterized protein Veg
LKKQPISLADIKKEVDAIVGTKVRFRAAKSRKRVDEQVGILENAYPNIFVINVSETEEDFSHRLSFSYSDLLTQNVELYKVDNEGEQRIDFF